MSLREAMPQTAAFIDAMREAFGVAEVNAQIKRGMAGGTEFYARERGREIGRRDTREGVPVTIAREVVIGKTRHGR